MKSSKSVVSVGLSYTPGCMPKYLPPQVACAKKVIIIGTVSGLVCAPPNIS